MRTISLCGFRESYNLNRSSECRKVKVASLETDSGKLVMPTSFGVCNGKGGTEEKTGRNLPDAGYSSAESVSRLPDLKRRERMVLFCLFLETTQKM